MSTLMHTLASGLAPAVLRVGGRSADETIFVPDEHDEGRFRSNSNPWYQSGNNSHMNKIFTGTVWKMLNEFCIQTGLDLLFDLNILLRDGGDRWDPTNAKQLFEFNSKIGYNVMWQLGNEPTLFPMNYGISMGGRQVGKAYNKLRWNLSEDRFRQNNFVVGPETTHLPVEKYGEKENATAFLENFLHVAGDVINVTSIHFYNIRKKDSNTTIDDYTNPDFLDKAWFEMEKFSNVIRRSMSAGSRKRWLTETSPCTSGGLEASSQYMAGFIVLNNLGIAAVMDISVSVYWTLYSDAHYSLLNYFNYQPKPMYWVCYLHKRLVGQRVLSVQPLVALEEHPVWDNATRYVRIFAHCTKESSSYGAGTVTIIAINMLNTSHVSLQLTGRLGGKAVDEYHLSPHGGNITATHINLNGRKLEMIEDKTFPDIIPRHLPPGSMITLPPMTYGYYVIPDADVSACHSKG